MKRHPALQDLSRDHFHVLVRCQELRRALQSEASADVLREWVSRFFAFFESDMSPHFEEEDKIVVPAAASAETLRAVASKTLSEHVELREAIQGLARLRSEPDDRLRAALKWIEPHITEHVKMEEEELFEGVQRELTNSELDELERRSLEFRRVHRAPEAIGPGRTCPPDRAGPRSRRTQGAD